MSKGFLYGPKIKERVTHFQKKYTDAREKAEVSNPKPIYQYM